MNGIRHTATRNTIVRDDLDYIWRGFGKAELFKDKVVLITGCGGFLGFYFVQFFCDLARRGMPVKRLILLDSFLLGTPAWLTEITAMYPEVECHKFDISSDNLSEISSSAEADYVIHMASIASPVFYRQFPLETLDANVWGLRKLLDYYSTKALHGFLFFSSSEIYGDPEDEHIPTPEDYRGRVSCVGPRACYDEAKRFGETVCYVFAKTRKLPVRVVRPFNNFGPGMRLNDGRVPADFARAVTSGQDIVMYSDGTPTRTFCYVTDAIVGYLKALTYHEFDCFNIGMERPEISIRQFAEIYQRQAARVLGYRGKAVLAVAQDKDFLTHNPSRRCPNITRARTLLGFAPVFDPERGVERFLQYLQQEKDA